MCLLQAENFKVWVDVDNMGGSTLDAMADAIENAQCVLMCVSERYKMSNNCRSGENKIPGNHQLHCV